MPSYIIAPQRRSSENDVRVKKPDTPSRQSLAREAGFLSKFEQKPAATSDLARLMAEYDTATSRMGSSLAGREDTTHDCLLPTRDVSSPAPPHLLQAKPSCLFVRRRVVAPSLSLEAAGTVPFADGCETSDTVPFSDGCGEVSQACVEATLRVLALDGGKRRASIHALPFQRPTTLGRSLSLPSFPAAMPPVAQGPFDTLPQSPHRRGASRSQLRELPHFLENVMEGLAEEPTALDVKERPSSLRLRRRHSDVSLAVTHQHVPHGSEVAAVDLRHLRRASESTISEPTVATISGARQGGAEQGPPRRNSSAGPTLSLSLTQLYKHMTTRLAQRALAPGESGARLGHGTQRPRRVSNTIHAAGGNGGKYMRGAVQDDGEGFAGRTSSC
ncbi:hypothetical protein T484DRAFT_1974131 [Baffinella frigidus]|nr:hypothetical protein T484DRAFT_1974131 [Cryptophyta sp. CCMP2293]